MEKNISPTNIIQILPKYVQALCSDGVLYFSGEPRIATDDRKAILINDINLIKEHIATLEEILG